MVQMLWLGGIGLAALATVIWPRWLLAVLRLRALTQWGESDEEPDHRGFRTWPIRAVAAAVLAVVVAISVYALWPVDHALKRFAGVGAFLVLSIALAIWFLAALVAHRDTASRARLEAIAGGDYEVVRRTESGFAFDFLAVAAVVLTVAVTGGVLANLLRPQQSESADPTPTPTETQNLVDETLSDFNDLHPQYEHLDAMPEDSLAIGPWWYNVVDAVNQEPYNVWHRSEPLYGGDVDTYLNNADVVLSTPGFGCGVIGMMVVETETTVSVAIVVVDPSPNSAATPTATPDPATPSPEASPTPTPTPTPPGLDFRCVGGNGVFRDWFPVDLAAPLGDRTVQTLDGRRISEAR